MRVKEGYYDVLEDLDKHFPAKSMLTRKDVQAYTGWSDKTVRKNIDFGNKYSQYIHKTAFARQLI